MFRDRLPGDVITIEFTTLGQNDEATTLDVAPAPAFTVYKSSTPTPSAAGLTVVSTAFDSIPGIVRLNLDTGASPTFFTNGATYSVKFVAGVVDTVDLAGQPVYEFSLGLFAAAATAFGVAKLSDLINVQNAILSAIAMGSSPSAIADGILRRHLAGGTDDLAADGRNVSNALRLARNKVEIAGGVITAYQEDDATPAWTAPVATAPGNPLVRRGPP